jgi:hypothetical protein
LFLKFADTLLQGLNLVSRPPSDNALGFAVTGALLQQLF